MRRYLLLLTGLAAFAISCKKEPGIGGRAEVRGVVMRQDVNALGIPVGNPYPYQDTRVFIVYGDHDFYDDDVRTGPDGLFVFRWLRKGDYTVYTFGECNCPGKSVSITRSVQVSGNKDVVTVPTIIADNF